MNQPSAEELIASFYESGDGHLPHKIIAMRILDRYHLIDKTEPIPGAVTRDELEDKWISESGEMGRFEFILNTFDIYPKGTVARLMGEVDFHKQNAGYWASDKEKLQAEVERLSDEIEVLENKNLELKNTNQELLDIVIKSKKPEAVGCGKKFNINAIDVFDCGEYGNLCPDCQAKANQPEKPDSSKRADLPDVPKRKYFSKREWMEYMTYFCEAVKAHLEGKDAK